MTSTKTDNSVQAEKNGKVGTTNAIEHSLLQNQDNGLKKQKHFIVLKCLDFLISVLQFSKKILNPIQAKEEKILKEAYKEKYKVLNILQKAKKDDYKDIELNDSSISFSKTENASYYTMKETLKNKTANETDFNPEDLKIYAIRKGITLTSDTYKIKYTYKYNQDGNLSYYSKNSTYKKTN